MLSVKDMSLSKKLIGGFSTVIILLAIVGIVGYYGVSQINGEVDGIVEQIEMKNSITSLSETTLEITEATYAYGLGEEGGKEEAEVLTRDFDTIIGDLESKNLNEAEKQDMAGIESLHSKFEESRQELIETSEAARINNNVNIKSSLDKYDGDRKNLEKAISELETMQGEEMKLSETNAEASVKSSYLFSSDTIPV